MTRAEREMLVERYLAFEMSASEEQEFIIRAATDGELLRMLRASRLVGNMLEKNRAKLSTGHLAVRDRALSVLAATPAPAEAAASVEPPRTTAQIIRGRAGWLTHAATAVVFSIGGYLSHQIFPPAERRASDQVSTTLQAPRSTIASPPDSVTSLSVPQVTRQTGPVVIGPGPATGRSSARTEQKSALRQSSGSVVLDAGGSSTTAGAHTEPQTPPVSVPPRLTPERTTPSQPTAEPSRSGPKDSIRFRGRIRLPERK